MEEKGVRTFTEVKLFQVKPDKLAAFESLIAAMAEMQRQQPGCISLKYMKRSYILQGKSLPPRELTRIVKCVKFYSWWEFDTKENYGAASDWFFENYLRPVSRLLTEPFSINLGGSCDV